MILVALDPSSQCTGAALFQDGALIWCGYWKRSRAKAAGTWQWQLVRWMGSITDRMLNWPKDQRQAVIETYGPWEYSPDFQTPRAWIEAVGICRAALLPVLPTSDACAETDAEWIKRQGYADAQYRMTCAGGLARTRVTNIDAATAILLGQYCLSGQLARDAAVASAKKAHKTPPTGAKPRPQQPVAVAASQARPGRRLRTGATNE